MKILFDTNILLDVLLERLPHAADSAASMAQVEEGMITGYLCAHTVTTLFYFLEKALGRKHARTHVARLLSIFEVAAVNRAVLTPAVASGFSDYEDAVVHEAAVAVGADAVVTRNAKDFAGARLAILTPRELLAAIRALQG